MIVSSERISTNDLAPVGFWHTSAVIQPNNFVTRVFHNGLSISQSAAAMGAVFVMFQAQQRSNKDRCCEITASPIRTKNGELHSFCDPGMRGNFQHRCVLRSDCQNGKSSGDSNRAVIYCSTTDPYQVIYHPISARQRELTRAARYLIVRSLELIRDCSTLNVRILTRSPLARLDFDLFRSFGKRLVFGMSLPTTRNDLAKIYEPRAPSPTQRLATLKAAKAAGLHVYVAIAPTYPECDEDDLRKTLSAVAELDPITIFHEPINIRAENVARIQRTADALRVSLNTAVFSAREEWQGYALNALRTVERLAKNLESAGGCIFGRTNHWHHKPFSHECQIHPPI